jgi:PAS domain S-box-containing protein
VALPASSPSIAAKTGAFSEVEVNVQYRPADQGQLVAFLQDITERKRAENELNLFFDLVPDMICIATTDGHFKKTNKAWGEVLGYSPEELLKMALPDLIHPDDLAATMAEIEKQLAGDSTINFINRYRCKDGSYRWLEWASVPASDQTLLFAAARDVTGRIKAEEEKQLLEQQFQQAQKMESLGILAGGIAHDFNNILAIIMGNCSLAKLDTENSTNYIPEIEKATDRAAGLCRQMLTYAGKAQLTRSQVNLCVLVDEMITMLKATLPHNVIINPDLRAEVPYIHGDASQIRQIIMNLVINSSEAIGEAQGEIRVSLANTRVMAGQEEDYHGKAIPSGEYVRLEVADTGCGMDAETKWRIFEPFYTTKFTGRGLGMSAVLGIIAAHQGAMQLYSRVGQGTTFKVYLPRDHAGANSEIESEAAEPWQGSGTILLVEDEEMVRAVANSLLSLLGFTVIEASNGKEALELYRLNACDITLVVTDVGMPIMDGYTLFRELKRFDAGLPIIVSSGFGESVVTTRIAKEEIDGQVCKPYTFEQLRDVVKSVLAH